MQQVSISRSLVLLVLAPARLTTSKDHQTTAEHRQEMIWLFAVNHSYLQPQTTEHKRGNARHNMPSNTEEHKGMYQLVGHL